MTTVLQFGPLPKIVRTRKPKTAKRLVLDQRGWLWLHDPNGALPWKLVSEPNMVEGTADSYYFAAHKLLASGRWTPDFEQGVIVSARTGAPLKASDLSQDGYLSLGLKASGRTVHVRLSRVLYESYHGPLEPGLTVNHRNGDNADNRASNLEAMTNGDNIRHAVALGRNTQRLSVDQVSHIRALAEHLSNRAIARQLGLTCHQVGRVMSGRSYRSVTS